VNVRMGSLGKSLVVVVLAALVLAACSSLEAEPGMALEDGEISTSITWGQPTDGAYDNVGTLLFVQNGDGYFSCTGTMIAPRIMLTAAHCVSDQGKPNDVTYVRFEDDAMTGRAGVTLQEWLENEWIEAETVIAHPDWVDYAGFPNTFDIGVVILPVGAGYTPASGFGEIPDLGFLESLRGRDRQDFVAVGYGLQGTLRPFFMDEYVKYQGNVRLVELNSRFNGFGAQSAKFSNNPGVGGGTCYGDSGGPTFYQNTNRLVAVTSFGWAKNGNCVGNDFNFRTDTPAAQSFINDMLADYGD